MLLTAQTQAHPMSDQSKRTGRPRKHPSTPFQEWVKIHYPTEEQLKALADELGISERYLVEVLRGLEIPSVPLAKKIKLLSGGALDLDAILDFQATTQP